MKEFDQLLEVIKTLRGENGCPWDKEQSVQSMASSVVEEAFELVESIEKNSNEDLVEELGDLMFLSLFISYMGEQEKRFKVSEVIQGVADKLIRRHPHVFGDLKEKNVDQIIVNWEAIKHTEQKNLKRTTPFDGIPAGLPEVQRFFKIVDKSRRAGGDIPHIKLEDAQKKLSSYAGNKGEETMSEFIKSLLVYCQQENVDLPKIIRTLSDQTMHDFNQKNKK